MSYVRERKYERNVLQDVCWKALKLFISTCLDSDAKSHDGSEAARLALPTRGAQNCSKSDTVPHPIVRQ